MVTRDAFIWDFIGNVPLLREEITEIERIEDTDKFVEGLLEFYRGVDDLIWDVQKELQAEVSGIRYLVSGADTAIAQ